VTGGMEAFTMVGQLSSVVSVEGRVPSVAAARSERAGLFSPAVLACNTFPGTQTHSAKGLLGFGVFAGTLAVVLQDKVRRRRQRSCRVVRAAGPGEEDVFELMSVGLKSLLGVKENKMEAQLQRACQVADDFNKCIADTEVKLKVTEDELSKVKMQRDAARNELDKAAKQLAEVKGKMSKLATAKMDAQKFEEELKNKKTKISSLETQVAEASSVASAKESELKDEKATCSAAETELANLKQQLATAQEELKKKKAAPKAAPKKEAAPKKAAAPKK